MEIQWLKCDAKLLMSLESISSVSVVMVGEVEVNSNGEDDNEMLNGWPGGGGKETVLDEAAVTAKVAWQVDGIKGLTEVIDM